MFQKRNITLDTLIPIGSARFTCWDLPNMIQEEKDEELEFDHCNQPLLYFLMNKTQRSSTLDEQNSTTAYRKSC